MSIHFSAHDRAFVVDAVGSWRTDRLLLSTHDATRLRELVVSTWREGSRDAGRLEAALLLATALRSAIVVPPDRIPRDVVTMRSRLVLKDVVTGERRDAVLVYPEEQHGDSLVSVLSPLGVALLGLSEGALLTVPRSAGRSAVLRVEAIRYQPEAAGELHL